MENQQLIKKDRSANSYSKIFPWTFTDLVLDRVTKESLDNILVRNNFIALSYVGSKAATRLQVPMKNRRRGIWLSYIDYTDTLTVEYYNDNNLDDNHWQDSSYWLPYNTAEFQPASVGLSALAQEVFDWINSQITTAVKLNPEDLQKNSSGQLEEANRSYDTSTFSGLGYRILRKNIQSNKNILTQSMINMPNNIYKIRYDFDLNGATINLPANSVLQFVGGSIKNGTLNGNNTIIEADSNAVIFDSVVIKSTWNVEHIYDSWFAFNPSPSYLSNQIITNILALSNDNVYNTIHFDADRTYYFELPYKGKTNLGDDIRPDYWKLNTEEYAFLRIFTNFTSNTHLIVNNTIQMLATNQGAYFVFHIEGKSNIEISGTGVINADAKDHLYTDPFAGTDYYGEWGHIFNFKSCDNIVIRDITVGYAFGDALAFSNIAYNNNGVKAAGPATKNVLIDGVKVLYARRNGIALGGNNYTITNVYFEGCGSDEIKGTAPMAGIDFENDYTEVEPSGVCSNVSMSSCKFKNNKYDVSSTIRDDLGSVPRGQLVTISDCNFTAPLRLNRTNGLTFNNCHIVGISSHDNSISPWFISKDLVFNSCVFDELNPYLAISAEEQNKKFINPTYPEDIKYSTTFQQSLATGRALKFTIPKPLVGLVEFTAFCSNPNYSSVQMPINITEYSFGNSQRLTGIRDIKVKAAQDNTLRYASYRNVPVFSYINYAEDADNFNIYFAIGGDLIDNPLGGNTSVNIFLTSKTKFIVVEAPVSENPGIAGMYGGKWSTLSAITKSVIDVTAIPSSVTFPSKEMFPANMLADLPTSLTSDKVGFSQYVLDNSYKCPVFWDSYSSVFRTADGNRALVRSVTSSDALNTLTAQLTTNDRGYVVYTTVNTSYLTWNGYDWVNEDGSLFTEVKYVKRTVDITTLNKIFSHSNVVYKIVGDIDLAKGTLTIATGSTLDFQGGSFNNGTIIGSNTRFSGNIKLDTTLTFSGTYLLDTVNVDWFYTTRDSDASPYIQAALDFAKLIKASVTFGNKLKSGYIIKTTLNCDVPIIGNNARLSSTTVGVLNCKNECSIENLYIDFYPYQGASDVTDNKVIAINIGGETSTYNHYINNVTIDGFYYGIVMTNSWNLRCSNLRITRTRIGIQAYGKCVNNSIVNANIDCKGTNSICIAFNDEVDHAGSTYLSEGWTISNSILTSAQYGIFGVNMSNTFISNCIIDLCSKNAIKFSLNSLNIRIIDNYLACLANGIDVINFSGQNVLNNEDAGIIISNNTIKSYYSDSGACNGINIGEGTYESIYILGNTISNLGGIGIVSLNGKIMHINVSNNRFKINAGGYFYVLKATNKYIANNNAIDNYNNSGIKVANKMIIVADSAPTSNTKTWNAGDICLNSKASVGSIIGWFCATSGSPGTWFPIGTIEQYAGLKKQGTTAERPAMNQNYIGATYYDTTLKKMILWNGTAWTNLDGSALT